MTNEEAVVILKNAIKKPNTEDGYLGQALTMAIKALEQQSETNAPNTLCKEVKDISFCSDCVSYRHCEAVHQWILRGIAQYNAELTKQTNEAVWKDWGDILRSVIRRCEDEDNEALEMAEDCVKREPIQKAIKDMLFWINGKNRGNADYFIVDQIEEIIKKLDIDNLPSVQPQPKTLSDTEINTFVDSMKNMRKATKEESKSTVEYIDSISKPTGFLFDEAYEELVFVEPHKKLSINLQPCEDCISREQAVYVASGYCAPQNIADELRKLPSVTPQPKRGKWIDTGMWLEGRKYGKEHGEMIDAYSCEYCGYSQYHKTNFCPNCGCYCGGDDNGNPECTM